jgi:hypothetical protein
MNFPSLLIVLVALNIVGCATPVPPPESSVMVPKKLNLTFPSGTSIFVAEPGLDSAAATGTAPFDHVAGKFPLVQQQGLSNFRESVRLALVSAGAVSPGESQGESYILYPIILGGLAIPFPEAYSVLFVRYELEDARNGEIVWSRNIYSQAKLETIGSSRPASNEPHPAYARLASANLRQMATYLSEWLEVSQ